MTTHLLHDRLRSFLLNLECLGPIGQKDAFANEVIETGGSYVAPNDDGRSSHLFEISLHGIVGNGFSEETAIESWKMAARAMVPLADPTDAPAQASAQTGAQHG